VLAFVRGLVDTDGCSYIHKQQLAGRRYENIGFCFIGMFRLLIQSVANVLRQANI